MSIPVKPTPKAVFGQAVTDFNLSITYYGPLPACVDLFGLAETVPLTFSLAATTGMGLASVTVSAEPDVDEISPNAALRYLQQVHDRAVALKLSQSRYDDN